MDLMFMMKLLLIKIDLTFLKPNKIADKKLWSTSEKTDHHWF